MLAGPDLRFPGIQYRSPGPRHISGVVSHQRQAPGNCGGSNQCVQAGQKSRLGLDFAVLQGNGIVYVDNTIVEPVRNEFKHRFQAAPLPTTRKLTDTFHNSAIVMMLKCRSSQSTVSSQVNKP